MKKLAARPVPTPYRSSTLSPAQLTAPMKAQSNKVLKETFKSVSKKIRGALLRGESGTKAFRRSILVILSRVA